MQATHKRSLNIITALNCEAKPIIDFYRLSKKRSKPFDYYTGTSVSIAGQEFVINLLVSGIGCLNMSTACGWLASQTDNLQTIWLNVGTAGHKDLTVGSIVRVNRSIDISTGQSHYPHMAVKWQAEKSPLLTVEAASSDYPEGALVDMEGTAFFKSAGLFATTELIQSIKIVSDNETNSLERLNAALISQLIEPHAKTLNEFALRLIDLLPPKHDVSEYLSLIDHLHSTVSQRQQYKELLSKLLSLHQLNEQSKDQIKSVTSMSSLLIILKNQLQMTQPNLVEMVD